jgi:hypothetical protein
MHRARIISTIQLLTSRAMRGATENNVRPRAVFAKLGAGEVEQRLWSARCDVRPDVESYCNFCLGKPCRAFKRIDRPRRRSRRVQ